uniref:Rab-GAP TBC domain-containing protein n=2 Tax=Lotharella globosa TaxID=91324 RepID=A0A7S3YUW8_9EUKA
MNSVAGLCCLSATDDAQAFRLTNALMRHPGYRHREVFGRGQGRDIGFPLACQLGWILDRLMEKYHPKLSVHLNKTLAMMNCPKGMFSGRNVGFMTLKWFLTLFASVVPPPVSLHIYDLFVADGHVAALRAAMLSIADVESQWLATPVGDTKVLQPKLWHHKADPDGCPSEDLRDTWTRDPWALVTAIRASPPSVEEFEALRSEYAQLQAMKKTAS